MKVTHDMIKNPHRTKITVKKSPTADTRSCNPKEVKKITLSESSYLHINEVDAALLFLEKELQCRGFHASVNGASYGVYHDHDKMSDIDGFHRDFVAAEDRPFIEGEWYKNHLKANRHHLNTPEGVPADVNLIDVLEHIADCAVAGMARTGEVYPIKLDTELLEEAVQNTLKLLVENIEVKPLQADTESVEEYYCECPECAVEFLGIPDETLCPKCGQEFAEAMEF